jgi:peptide/nickel transport system permease protein
MALRAFILRRVAVGLLTIWLATVVVFLLVHVIPGDPIGALLQQNTSPQAREALERLYGLDKPLHVQYVHWLGNVVQGDLGRSVVNGSEIAPRLWQRLPRSIYLMVGAIVLSLVLSFVAGSIAALRKGKPTDVFVTGLALLFQSTPQFWLAILLILVFGVELGWLPTADYVAPEDDVVQFVRHAILPMVAAGGTLIGITTRTVRASLVGEIRQDYVQLAESSGIPFGRRILPVHVTRNALIPIITLLGLEIGVLLSGAVVVEKVFSYPGLGLMLIDSVQVRDYPTIQACILLFTTIFVVVNLAVDIAVFALDPKQVRTGRRA